MGSQLVPLGLKGRRVASYQEKVPHKALQLSKGQNNSISPGIRVLVFRV